VDGKRVVGWVSGQVQQCAGQHARRCARCHGCQAASPAATAHARASGLLLLLLLLVARLAQLGHPPRLACPPCTALLLTCT
jgi:hypothetical protein